MCIHIMTGIAMLDCSRKESSVVTCEHRSSNVVLCRHGLVTYIVMRVWSYDLHSNVSVVL